MKRSITSGRALALLATVTACVTTVALLAARSVIAAEAVEPIMFDATVVRWAFASAALATALAALAAGYAVGRVGSAAIGAIAEKPELFGRALVLVGLAEGIAIYGLIVSILILNRVG